MSTLEPTPEQFEALASRRGDKPRRGGKPSPAAFLDMVTNEEYLKIHDHRANALDRGDLIATSTWTVAD